MLILLIYYQYSVTLYYARSSGVTWCLYLEHLVAVIVRRQASFTSGAFFVGRATRLRTFDIVDDGAAETVREDIVLLVERDFEAEARLQRPLGRLVANGRSLRYRVPGRVRRSAVARKPFVLETLYECVPLLVCNASVRITRLDR